jgi:hypothetical protein
MRLDHRMAEWLEEGISNTGEAAIWDNDWFKTNKKSPWPDFASKLFRPTDRRLSAKLVPTFANSWCHIVSVTHPYNSILGFIGRSHYFFFKVAPQLYLRLWVDSVPDPLLLRKYCSAGNRTRTPGSVARNSGLQLVWRSRNRGSIRLPHTLPYAFMP